MPGAGEEGRDVEPLAELRRRLDELEAMTWDLWLDGMNYTAPGQQTADRAIHLATQAEAVLRAATATDELAQQHAWPAPPGVAAAREVLLATLTILQTVKPSRDIEPSAFAVPDASEIRDAIQRLGERPSA